MSLPADVPESHRPRRTGRRRWLLVGLGVLLVAAGAAVLGRIALYRAGVDHRARALLATVAPTPSASPSRAAAVCRTVPPSRPRPAGRVRLVLAVPGLGLRAPVLAGTGNRVLDEAVGHVDATSWPDQAGTTVLAAHDVSFFSGLDRLRAGARVRLSIGCRFWDYRVDRRTVVRAGAPVPASPGPRVAMVTCWPTNALFYTPDRLVVTAHLVAAGSTVSPAVAAARVPPAPPAALPAALARRDLSLRSFAVPMGRLHLLGPFVSGFRESDGPLAVEEQAIRLLDAATLTLGTGRAGWWSTEAPGLPFAAVAGPTYRQVGYAAPLQVTLVGSGDTVASVRLSSALVTATGPADLRIVLVPRRGRLVIGSWHLGTR